MTAEHFDDDENVKMMRDTARQVGLTDLVRRAFENQEEAQALLRKALRLLGENTLDQGRM